MSLSEQIEELEEDCAAAQSRASELAEECRRMLDDISDLEATIEEHEAYIDWIDELYPEARIAYAAKQRLDQAT